MFKDQIKLTMGCLLTVGRMGCRCVPYNANYRRAWTKCCYQTSCRAFKCLLNLAITDHFAR